MTNLVRKAFLLIAFAYAQIAAAQTRADGLAAMQLEDWDRAISVYTALIKADPTDQDAFLSLSNVYLAKGDKAKALETAQAAFTAKPDDPMAFVVNAKVEQLKDKPSEASAQFERAAKKAKKNINALRQIGESYTFYIPPGSKKPDLTRATELLLAAVDANSKDLASLMALGYAYKEQGNGGLAATYYEQAESLDPKNPLPKLMLAKVYKAAKIPEKFEIYVNKAISVAPSYTPALRAKAEYFFFGRKWEEATTAYDDLVKNGAEVKIEDEMQLANCLFITHKCPACSELVEKILKKDPSKNYLRRLKAYCDYENGEYMRGLQILNDYFKTAPADKIIPRDYEYLGRFQIKTKGDTIAALGNLKKSIDMDSSTWPLHLEIAKTYYSRRMNCEATAEYQLYFDSAGMKDPKLAQDLYFMGLSQYFCTADSLNYIKAEKIFAQVAVLVPSAGIGWLWAAKSANKQDPTPEQITADPEMAKQYGKARAYYEEYVKVITDKVKNQKDLIAAYQYLAYCYFVSNQADKFFPAIEKWLEVEPNPDAQKSIMEMKDAFGKDTVPGTTTPGTSPAPPNGGGKGRN